MTASRTSDPGQRPVKAPAPRLVGPLRWMPIDEWLNSTGNSAVRAIDISRGKGLPEELPGAAAEVFDRRS